jgi:hypothetical protein
VHVQHQDYKRSIGYDYSAVGPRNKVSAVPRVKWIRCEFASGTLESAPPAQILNSYNAWNTWAGTANKVWALIWIHAGLFCFATLPERMAHRLIDHCACAMVSQTAQLAL